MLKNAVICLFLQTKYLHTDTNFHTFLAQPNHSNPRQIHNWIILVKQSNNPMMTDFKNIFDWHKELAV
jgi:hypothetical protein